MSHRSNDDHTIAIHAGWDPVSGGGAVNPPIVQSSTFAFPSADEGAARFGGRSSGAIYTRLGNPTVDALEGAVAELEGAVGAVATATGMAAVSTALLATVAAGDHVVCSAVVYGPTRTLLERDLRRFGVTSTFVDSSRPGAVAEAVRSDTAAVVVETPANPTLDVTDLAAAAEAAHGVGARLIVDSTFASPVLQKPLAHGADVVLHSMTKFINGHSDVVAGIVAAADPELVSDLRRTATTFGMTMDPHQAYLVLRGLRTLPLRMEKAQANAGVLAGWLESHDLVEWVRYPGLASHPQHELSSRQMRGPGAVIAFGVAGGVEAGRLLMDNVRLATLAVSLGGVETLIEHPASMTHAGLSRAARENAGISDGLVRLAVGCESVDDLLDDLASAFAVVEAELELTR